jgi:hypothetical protein
MINNGYFLRRFKGMSHHIMNESYMRGVDV